MKNGDVVWAVATGGVDPNNEASAAAAEFISRLDGFVAVTPHKYATALLWAFDSEASATAARDTMRQKGIKCSSTIRRGRIKLTIGGADG